MRFRKLRFAWSAVCGIACLLLIALWVRTGYAIDSVCGPIGSVNGFIMSSRQGGLGFAVLHDKRPWRYYRHPLGSEPDVEYATALGFGAARLAATLPLTLAIRIPYWFVASMSGILAAAPLIKRPHRFSLRTLLIATTLVAVVLGLIMYATRS